MVNPGKKVDRERRCLLFASASFCGVADLATAVPFAAGFLPSQQGKLAGAPVEIDIGKLAPGQMMTFEWRGKPVWIIHRNPEMLGSLKRGKDRVGEPMRVAMQRDDAAFWFGVAPPDLSLTARARDSAANFGAGESLRRKRGEHGRPLEEALRSEARQRQPALTLGR